ncbi:MAG: hypothetical protein ACYTE3_03210 [Planctomycetota bacterium]|jgi:hypothetical protein
MNCSRHILIAVLTFGQAAAVVSAQEAPGPTGKTTTDPAGTWRREYDWYETRIEEVIRLNVKEAGKVVGTLSRNDRASEIKDGKLKGNELSFCTSDNYQGTEWVTRFKGTVTGDDIDGTVVLEVGGQSWDFPWTPTRSVQMDDVVGLWQIRIESPDGNVLEPTMKISKDGGKYKGAYTSTQGQELDVKDLRVEKNVLKFTVTAEFDGYSMKVDYRGRPYGNKISGSLDYDFDGNTGQVEFTARRKQVDAFRNGMPLAFLEDFEGGAERWTQTDAKAWQIAEEGRNHVYSQFQKSDYQPPVRSPLNMALVKDFEVDDFVLEARMEQTGKEYGHRDMCIFFGYQDPSHFYYVHIATKADAHANSIFIVNGKPRVSIATDRTDGTDWGTGYHDVRIVRDCQTGAIEVYFDDMDKPIMQAKDDTFKTGRVGFGSFDDTGKIDDVCVWAIGGES